MEELESSVLYLVQTLLARQTFLVWIRIQLLPELNPLTDTCENSYENLRRLMSTADQQGPNLLSLIIVILVNRSPQKWISARCSNKGGFTLVVKYLQKCCNFCVYSGKFKDAFANEFVKNPSIFCKSRVINVGWNVMNPVWLEPQQPSWIFCMTCRFMRIPSIFQIFFVNF